MSTTPQETLTPPTTESSLGENSGLSKSNTENLKTCYPDSPTHKSSVVIKIDGIEKTLPESGRSLEYKRLFYQACMRGESKSSAFGDQDMSYGTSEGTSQSRKPPDYESVQPEGETKAGGGNSTISASGLGPNISTDPTVMADVKPTANLPTPKASSLEMTPSPDQIPATFDIGKSSASSIGEANGNINTGQSAPVAP